MLTRIRIIHTALLLSFALLSASCIAQQDAKADSLQRVLKTQKDDTSKVNTLNALSSHVSNPSNRSLALFSQAQKHAQDALALAEKLNFKKGVARSLENLGESYLLKVNYTDALKNMFSALKHRNEIGNKKDIATCYTKIGAIYAQQGDYSESLKNLFNALKISKEIGDKENMYVCYSDISSQYHRQGNYPDAWKNSFAALKLAEEMKDRIKLIKSNNSIAAFYNQQENLSQALKYYFNSLKFSKEIGDKAKTADTYSFIAFTHQKQGNYAEALKNYMSAIKVSEDAGDKSRVYITYNNIASIYRQQKNFPEALKNYGIAHKIIWETNQKMMIAGSYRNIGDTYLDWTQEIKNADSSLYRDKFFSEALKNYSASLKLYEEEKSKIGISYAYASIGDVHRLQKNFSEALKKYISAGKIRKEIGDIKMMASDYWKMANIYSELKEFSEAKKSLEVALFVSRETGNKVRIKDGYERLAVIDSASGNWEGAYHNHKMAVLYSDSINNKENTEKILRLQMQYEFDKKEDSLKYQQGLNDARLQQQILLNQQQQQMLLLNEKDLALLSNEKQLQLLQIEKSEADFAVQNALQKSEAQKRQDQLKLLNKEKAIQFFELSKQKQLRNFMIAGFILFALLSFFIYRNYRIRQNLKLQSLRNKIASDLHDDVGSTLSSISIFSQMALQQTKEVNPLLETIGESSRKMLDAMADIVWTVNPENDQFEKIIMRMRSFAYELLGAKKIDFEFITDDEVERIKLPMNVRKNLYLIFKEATNNMVKYSGADKALFSLKGDKNNLTLVITDNGKGFNAHQIVHGNGLKNMKKRADEIGAEFRIDSNPEKGTMVQLKVAV